MWCVWLSIKHSTSHINHPIRWSYNFKKLWKLIGWGTWLERMSQNWKYRSEISDPVYSEWGHTQTTVTSSKCNRLCVKERRARALPPWKQTLHPLSTASYKEIHVQVIKSNSIIKPERPRRFLMFYTLEHSRTIHLPHRDPNPQLIHQMKDAWVLKHTARSVKH